MRKDVPQESLDIMLASLSKATLKQYESFLKLFVNGFFKRKKLEFFNPSPEMVIQFLTENFEAGASYGTLNSHRSAISLISKDKISDDKLITRFLKDVFKLKPTQPKYNFT